MDGSRSSKENGTSPHQKSSLPPSGAFSRAAQRPARHFGSSPLVACAVTLQERNDAEVLFLGRVKPGKFSIAAWATACDSGCAAARVITNREASAMARTTTEGSEESER